MALASHNKLMLRELEEILEDEKEVSLLDALGEDDSNVDKFWNGDEVVLETKEGRYSVQIEVKKLG